MLVKGLRDINDFTGEVDQAFMNRKMAPDVDTAFLLTSIDHLFISASRVRELAGFGRDVSDMTPPHVVVALQAKFGNG